MSQFYSPKEVAQAVGVSESSLKRWVDKGLIRATKTAGGHRRVELDAVLEYIRQTGKKLLDPSILELPPGCGQNLPVSVEDVQKPFLKAIIAGDETLARALVVNAYLAGFTIADVCDRLITPVFHEVGNLWKCGSVQVYEERRACEICQRTIHELRRSVKQGGPNQPLAMGGTLDGDPYTIATSLAELVLRDCGWRAESLGNMLPFDSIRAAIIEQRPRLFWISVTSIRDPHRFTADFNMLFDVAQSTGTALAVGGQALTADLRQQIRFSHFSDNYGHLEQFGRTLLKSEIERAIPDVRRQPDGPSSNLDGPHRKSAGNDRQSPFR